MASLIFPLALSLFSQLIEAQSSPTVVCVAGQCLQGFPNTTLGATLSASGAPTSLQLLPGQYSSTTNPQLLHDILTSSSASLSPSPGFENSSASLKSLPLNLAIQPGLSIFTGALYSGQSAFTALPSSPGSNQSAPLSAKALFISSNTLAVVTSNNSRFVLWESVPDVSQLPLFSGLSLAGLQASSCSPSCSSAGICDPSGACSCRPNFTGTSCESCAKGFFGPSCSPCPAGCSQCDEGISGTGRCLTTTIANAPSSCNCLNGVCAQGGGCTCNQGWTKGDNGTECSKCSDGFFLTSTGDCKVCQLGCAQCEATSGACTACKSGFSQDANDRTKCNPPQSVTSSGQVCPDGSFSAGGQCSPCNSACATCTAGTANDCVACTQGTFKNPQGICIAADGDGVCNGSNGALVADNVKKECEACGAKCLTCKIPNFTVASTIQQLQCASCLPGSFLSNSACVDSCPVGTFVNPQDNVTCSACDPSCSSCSGSSTFCTACPSGQLATPDGKCASSCSLGTFPSPSTSPTQCRACHPDCASCSGSDFNQCSSCPVQNPVLSSGRCLSTCSKAQFFDVSSNSCQSCDGSCGSCSSKGLNNCLSCSGGDQVLRAGTCVAANCQQSTSVISELGVCLSEIANAPPSGTSPGSPLPSVSGITSPTVVRKKLEWWQILLMTLGCAFIFLIVLWLWRRRARKQRAKQTEEFARQKFGDGKSDWKWRLIRFGEKFFGHKKSTRINPGDIRMAQMDRDVEKNVTASELRISEPLRSKTYAHHTRAVPLDDDATSQRTASSLYSQPTGSRKMPLTRQPVDSRYSSSTYDSYYNQPEPATQVKPPGSKNPFWK